MTRATTITNATGRRRRWLRRFVITLATVLGVAIVLAGAAGAWFRIQLGRSLPQTEGERQLAGLSAEAVVERDALGVPTLRGASRLDVARALGFVHAQERFFQMDLLRRRSAGELAELFGPAALPTDRASRLHRFRARAARVLAEATSDDRALLEVYAAGVNAGLGALGAPPFEYLLLRATPQAWRAEDCALVVAAMFFDLQDEEGILEARNALLQEVFPEPLARFLNSTASEWDTPLEGETLPAPIVPSAEVFDLRRQDARPTTGQPRPVGRVAARVEPRETGGFATVLGLEEPEEGYRGSNNWAVAGTRTGDGRSILANDMHLAIGVPNIWFRASLEWDTGAGPHRVTGVTLPGVPSVIVGSNGSVAWGFTNTEADWTDRVSIETVDNDPSSYRTPDGVKPFEVFRERIRVNGEGDEWLEVRETIWGPVAKPDHRGRLFAISWVAHHAEGLNVRLAGMERVRSVEEALTMANLAGIPGQNFVVADARGSIGWTVGGRIPRRVGFDGRLSASWADGTRHWDGWYGPEAYPRVVNPSDGIIVTANNRVASARGVEMLGDGAYDPGARARQIRGGLLALQRPRVADMLGVHLDDRAILMERWRRVALGVLTDANVGRSEGRRALRRLVLDGWTGRASIDSVGYRLVREFRTRVSRLAFEPFVARLQAVDSDYRGATGREGPVWALVSQKPPHLLDPKYADWDALLAAAVDQTIEELSAGGRRLEEQTWGQANTSQVRHALSRAVPVLGWWLDMPREPLPGDSHMPRVQAPAAGASERLAVSPGHEEDGYLHMPGGQSGHPLSPHYRDGHLAWARGEPTSFMPGATVSRLVLRP